jgi:hypothetical protein
VYFVIDSVRKHTNNSLKLRISLSDVIKFASYSVGPVEVSLLLRDSDQSAFPNNDNILF